MKRRGVAGKSVAYNRIRRNLQTGDLILFHGLDLESEIIEIFELSLWSHVGMVVRMPCLNYPLLWESTPRHFLTDPLLDRPKAGPRLVSLDERLTMAIDKHLYDRFMVRSLRIHRSAQMLRTLSAFIAEVHLMDFPGNWHMLKDFLEGRLLKARPDTRCSFYCAELIAETYMRLGLMRKSPPSNAYLPKDFAPGGNLTLQKGATLEAGIYLRLQGV